MITFKEHAIQNAGIEIQTVDARELHKFLGVGRDFSNWIKGKIVKYNFVENQHFTLVRPNGKASHGGQNRIEGVVFGTCSKDRWKESLLVELAK